jgi:hypothetical protein
MPGKARPKAKSTSPASKPREVAKAKSPPKGNANAKPAPKTAAKAKSGVAKRSTSPRPRAWGDWREQTLDRMRALIREADPGVVEEVKWRKPSNAMKGVPTWSRGGLICTGETYKDKVKLTFARGASLDDPKGLLNSGLDGGTRRAIDIKENEVVDALAFKALVRAAAEANTLRAV